MKKLIIIISIVVVFILVISWIVYPFVIARDIQKVTNTDFSSVDKVSILSGNTGKKADIVGKENLQEFFRNFEGAKLKKDFDQRISKGFDYSVVLYKSGKTLVSFTFGYNQVGASKDGKIIRYISSKNIDDEQISRIAKKYSLR